MFVRTRPRFALTAGVALLLAGCAGSQAPLGASSTVSQRAFNKLPQWQVRGLARPVCPQVFGKPSCFALQVLKDGHATSCSPSSSCGWTATQLETAYGLTSSLGNGSGANVALVEAGDMPDAVSSVDAYRSEYGLPPVNLTRYNENGQQSNYPPSCTTYGWCRETYLDLDMVSAACPECNILLVETKGSIADLETGQVGAVTAGATIVSNSWGCSGSWDCFDSNFASYFATKGIAYLASSGDFGYNTTGGPADLANVIAVGGTQLAMKGSKYTESIWSDAAAGCADPNDVGDPGVPKPSWQKDPDCSYRTVADVSAESGCSPGVAAYEGTYGGWSTLCGTSVATPFTAGIIGLVGNATKLDAGRTFWSRTRGHKSYFHHPPGSESTCGDYLCGDGRYKKYYSGPGGWGTPKGITAY